VVERGGRGISLEGGVAPAEEEGLEVDDGHEVVGSWAMDGGAL
jgi:hypothetical protein